MGDHEINVLKEVIKSIADNNFEHAKPGIKSLREYNKRLKGIKKDIHALNRNLKKAEHYTLRAREDRNPKVIAEMKQEAFGYCKEALIIIEQLKTIANDF
jgi:hypothetical protein